MVARYALVSGLSHPCETGTRIKPQILRLYHWSSACAGTGRLVPAHRNGATAADRPIRSFKRAKRYFFIAALTGSFTFSTLSNSTLTIALPTFSHLADVDVLHDVAGLRIDRHRAARAFPLHALGSGDQRVAVGLAAGLLERLVDEVHAVIAADREEVGVALELGIERLDEVLVHLGLVVVVVVPGADAMPSASVAHALDARSRPPISPVPMILIFFGSMPRSANALPSAAGLRAARDEDEDALPD